MKYLEEALQGKSAWPGEEAFQRRLRASQPAEETLGLLCLMASFFTTTLQHFYETFMTACDATGIL